MFIDTTKSISNKFLEMNVDGTGSISSSKSSIKRRAPTAPHISQNNNKNTVSDNYEMLSKFCFFSQCLLYHQLI